MLTAALLFAQTTQADVHTVLMLAHVKGCWNYGWGAMFPLGWVSAHVTKILCSSFQLPRS